MKLIPKETPTKELHQYLLGTVSPRPICFASTIDEEGNHNLAPFSFYGVFGSNPPTVIFSPARRVRNNTTKHTLDNVLSQKEVVINSVSYDIVQQMNIASCEYPDGVDEFVKSGLTPIPSDLVKPMRVKESPVQMECIVKNVIAMGEHPGAGNLVICEVVCMHIDDNILDADQKIDPNLIDLVSRMNGDYYCRASGEAVFTVPKPNTNLGIGLDALPAPIRNSPILSGNDLGKLANVSTLPDFDLGKLSAASEEEIEKKHQKAATLLQKNDINQAWDVLIQ